MENYGALDRALAQMDALAEQISETTDRVTRLALSEEAYEACQAYRRADIHPQEEVVEDVDPSPEWWAVELFDEDILLVTVLDEERLPAVVDGDARRRILKTTKPTKVKLQKTREGFVTVNDEKIPY